MKKTILSIITLTLVLINVILSAVIVFSVVPAMKKTDTLITQVCKAIDLELENPLPGSSQTISIDDIVVYEIEDEITVNLKDGDDGDGHYVVLKVALSLNSADEDYAKYGTSELLSTKESLIRNKITEIYSNYTMEQAKELSNTTIKDEIVAALQGIYNSEFIYDISYDSIIFQ